MREKSPKTLPGDHGSQAFGAMLPHMNRRDLITLLGGDHRIAIRCTCGAEGVRVVGLLGGTFLGPNAANVAAFRQGLSDGGYVEGKNLTVEFRWAEGHYDRLPALAADLVGRRVDVIAIEGGVPSALAAQSATSTIPIVFVVGPDPVELGLVASLARPGANLTGISLMNTELMPKR